MTYLRKKSYLAVLILIYLPLKIWAQTALKEDFDNLENWEPLLFPKIEKPSDYALIREDDEGILEGRSQGGASGLTYRSTFDIRETPFLEWRWKIDDILEKGDGSRKSGDDYPIRIYVIFEYDPESAKGGQKFQYNLAKALYGEYPPDSALNYVWANREWDSDSLPNAYTDRAIMIAADSGRDSRGRWVSHRVNLLEDYRRHFKKEPPPRASLAVMSDSDNTGGSTLAWLDYIIVSKE